MALEQKLEQAVEDRKMAETAAKDSILKLKAAGSTLHVLLLKLVTEVRDNLQTGTKRAHGKRQDEIHVCTRERRYCLCLCMFEIICCKI